MRKLTLILVFSLIMFSSTSFAEWKKVSDEVVSITYADFVWESVRTYYVDFDRIRKHDGYIYWWNLADLEKAPLGTNNLSFKSYIQGDCKVFRLKPLSAFSYEEGMGKGIEENITPKNPQWEYPPPKSTIETVLKSVCEHAN